MDFVSCLNFIELNSSSKIICLYLANHSTRTSSYEDETKLSAPLDKKLDLHLDCAEPLCSNSSITSVLFIQY